MAKKKKVNVNKLTPKQVDELSVEIGTKVREICDESAEKINAILSVYGMKGKLHFLIEPLESKEKGNLKKQGPQALKEV